MKKNSTRLIAIVLLAVLMLVSAFPLADHYTDESGFQRTVEILDRQEARLATMTVGAITASTVIAAIPGDATTPVATKLADMTDMLTLALAAVLLERFLMTKLCWLSLRILIPVALLLLGVSLLTLRRTLFQAGKRLFLLGLVLSLVVPLGAGFSASMETMFQGQLDEAMGITEEVNAAQSDTTITEEQARQELSSPAKREFSWQDTLNFFTSLPSSVLGSIKDIPDSLSSGVGKLVEKAQHWIHALMTGIALMLVGTVAIPLGTFLLGIRIVSTIAGIDVDPFALLSAPRKVRKGISGQSSKN